MIIYGKGSLQPAARKKNFAVTFFKEIIHRICFANLYPIFIQMF